MEFREAAERYCAIVENAQGSDRDRFVGDLTVSLSEVLAAAYRIPRITELADAEPVGEPISHEDWFATMKRVQGVLGEWDDYWTTVNSLDGVGVNLSLADALADIWRDLRPGLDALEAGVPSSEVLWQWRFSFRAHWGDHAVEALRALHRRAVQAAE